MDICTFKEKTLKSIFKLEDLVSTIHDRLLHQPQEVPEMADTIGMGFDSFLEAVYSYLKSWVSPYVEESYEYITGCGEECENPEERCARLYARTDKIKELLDLINYRLEKIAEEFGLEYDGVCESPDSFPGYIKEMVKLENSFSLAIGLAYLIVEFLDGASCEEPEVYCGDREVSGGSTCGCHGKCSCEDEPVRVTVNLADKLGEADKEIKALNTKNNLLLENNAKLRNENAMLKEEVDEVLSHKAQLELTLNKMLNEKNTEIARLKHYNAELEDKINDLQNPPKKKSVKKIEE